MQMSFLLVEVLYRDPDYRDVLEPELRNSCKKLEKLKPLQLRNCFLINI